jgi:hypothetical protein
MTGLPRTAMATLNKNQTVEQSDPESIYKACLAQEKNTLKNWCGYPELVYRLFVLEHPIFPASMFIRDGAEKLGAKDRDILDRALLGNRCRGVFSRLKEAGTIEERWEILASWLKQEGVCKPEQILPFNIGKLARSRFFPTKVALYAILVEIWGPYFVGLMARIPPGGLTDRNRARLRNLKYDDDAITSVGSHQDPIPAICEWLANRELFLKPVDARTIRNAHSRCFGGRFSHSSFFLKQAPLTK